MEGLLKELLSKYKERKEMLAKPNQVLTPYSIAVNTGMSVATDQIIEDIEKISNIQ